MFQGLPHKIDQANLIMSHRTHIRPWPTNWGLNLSFQLDLHLRNGGLVLHQCDGSNHDVVRDGQPVADFWVSGTLVVGPFWPRAYRRKMGTVDK